MKIEIQALFLQEKGLTKRKQIYQYYQPREVFVYKSVGQVPLIRPDL